MEKLHFNDPSRAVQRQQALPLSLIDEKRVIEILQTAVTPENHALLQRFVDNYENFRGIVETSGLLPGGTVDTLAVLYRVPGLLTVAEAVTFGRHNIVKTWFSDGIPQLDRMTWADRFDIKDEPEVADGCVVVFYLEKRNALPFYETDEFTVPIFEALQSAEIEVGEFYGRHVADEVPTIAKMEFTLRSVLD